MRLEKNENQFRGSEESGLSRTLKTLVKNLECTRVLAVNVQLGPSVSRAGRRTGNGNEPRLTPLISSGIIVHSTILPSILIIPYCTSSSACSRSISCQRNEVKVANSGKKGKNQRRCPATGPPLQIQKRSSVVYWESLHNQMST